MSANASRLERYKKNRENYRKYHANKGTKAPNMSVSELMTMINLVSRVARQKESASRRTASAKKKK